MKVNTDDISISGTSLQGYIHITYEELLNALGKPNRGYDKSSVHWKIQFETGDIATIYDYNQLGVELNVSYYHIGGFSSVAVEKIATLFPDKKVTHKLI
jgi:hypothetical protein